ncbi:PREDICTED: AT-rich interactive domain-containing protein 1-like [Ipomoea nil]|uniref:AT-rich interactive domain-containing protein 1-like n=1 Tax=Ipomoea nil TaxID=35883 RepID=UPI000900B334|nr:PREDICTED: AT-rich interactive domain-containing protein 1-like [Ipomoea nil]XP_019188348.1 PREDICTED: AT-rich interactive domain-containing protein 1-like [Ipomoea nil]
MVKGKVRKEASKEPRKWVDYIQDESEKKAVPILAGRFQAELPEWIGPPKKGDQETELKWLGTQIWPIKNESSDTTTEEEEEEEDDVGIIGKGRAEELCDCESRGSVECVRRHVNDERIKLQSELGSAFWEWNFDGMGEEVSNQWTLEEQNKFESIVKMKPLLLSQGGKGFLKAAMAALPSHNTQSIISYYFNVYLPRRIAQETRRSDNKTANNTDDEDETKEATNSKTSRRKKRRIIS